MAQAQNVVYYDGVPYLSNQPAQQPRQQYNPFQMSNFGMGNLYSGYGGAGADPNANLTVDQLLERGLISPMAPTPPPAPTRPVQPLTQMPQSGWGAPTGGAPASLDAILNGGAQQFGKPQTPPPVQPGAPQPQQQPMPSPQQPQQNFDALGQNLMARVLQQKAQGGV